MEANGRLTDAGVRDIVERILGDRWRDIGYDHADVISEDDVYGEPSLTVTAWMNDPGSSMPVDLYSRTLLDLRHANREKGEERYAYLRLRHADDDLDLDDGSSDRLS